MALIVRQAGPADVQVVVEFNRLLAEESEGKRLEALVLRPGVTAVLADSRKGLYFLAEEGADTVGQLCLTFEWSDWRNGWFWWIQSVFVRPDFRRKGVFRSLYCYIEEKARRDPEVIGLRLYVEQGNAPAHATYAKLGLVRTGYWVLEKYPLKSVANNASAAFNH